MRRSNVSFLRQSPVNKNLVSPRDLATAVSVSVTLSCPESSHLAPQYQENIGIPGGRVDLRTKSPKDRRNLVLTKKLAAMALL
jgi:hypothetical protein